MWSGSPGPYIRPKAKGSRPARNMARRAERRRVLPGYPIEPRKFNLEEIRSYFAGDKITCLRCGKSYRVISVHLRLVHSLTADDYKGMYGLPWSRGLSSSASKGRRKSSTIASMDVDRLIAVAVDARMNLHGERRPRQPFRDEISIENLRRRKKREPQS